MPCSALAPIGQFPLPLQHIGQIKSATPTCIGFTASSAPDQYSYPCLTCNDWHRYSVIGNGCAFVPLALHVTMIPYGTLGSSQKDHPQASLHAASPQDWVETAPTAH